MQFYYRNTSMKKSINLETVSNDGHGRMTGQPVNSSPPVRQGQTAQNRRPLSPGFDNPHIEIYRRSRVPTQEEESPRESLSSELRCLSNLRSSSTNLNHRQNRHINHSQGTPLSRPESYNGSVSNVTTGNIPPIVHRSIIRINSSTRRISPLALVANVQSNTASHSTREIMCSPRHCYHMCPQSSFCYYPEFYSLCPPPRSPSPINSPPPVNVQYTNATISQTSIETQEKGHPSDQWYHHMRPQSSFHYCDKFYSLCPPPRVPDFSHSNSRTLSPSSSPSPSNSSPPSVSGTNPPQSTVNTKPCGHQYVSMYSHRNNRQLQELISRSRDSPLKRVSSHYNSTIAPSLMKRPSGIPLRCEPVLPPISQGKVGGGCSNKKKQTKNKKKSTFNDEIKQSSGMCIHIICDFILNMIIFSIGDVSAHSNEPIPANIPNMSSTILKGTLATVRDNEERTNKASPLGKKRCLIQDSKNTIEDVKVCANNESNQSKRWCPTERLESNNQMCTIAATGKCPRQAVRKSCTTAKRPPLAQATNYIGDTMSIKNDNINESTKQLHVPENSEERLLSVRERIDEQIDENMNDTEVEKEIDTESSELSLTYDPDEEEECTGLYERDDNEGPFDSERHYMKYLLHKVEWALPMETLPPFKFRQHMYSEPELETAERCYKTKMNLPANLESIPEDEETHHFCPHFDVSELKEMCRVYMRLHRKITKQEMNGIIMDVKLQMIEEEEESIEREEMKEEGNQIEETNGDEDRMSMVTLETDPQYNKDTNDNISLAGNDNSDK